MLDLIECISYGDNVFELLEMFTLANNLFFHRGEIVKKKKLICRIGDKINIKLMSFNKKLFKTKLPRTSKKKRVISYNVGHTLKV